MLTKKVILDVDPGIDDAVALAIALFHPQLDVVAVTATGGNVPPEQATRNVQAIIEQLDPPRWPRIGEASPSEDGLPADAQYIYGADGLGNANFVVSELQHRHPAEKVICDEVRAAPEQVTIVALGPLTNIARALQRDPALASLVGQLIIRGGAVNGAGNITPAAEFNVYCDPPAARAVLRSATTKTLVTLDVTAQLVFTYDLLNQLPPESTRAGRFLRKILPFAYRTHRQELALEGVYLHDCVALVAAMHPELFEVEMVGVDVELSGELSTGATICDRRRVPQWRPNVGLATTADLAAITDCVIRGLAAAGAASADDALNR